MKAPPGGGRTIIEFWGRNGTDTSGLTLLDNHCAEAMNIDWFNGGIGSKRNGSSSLGMTSSPFTNVLASLIAHVPSTDETLRELWGVDAALNVGRLAGGTAWATPTLKDAPTANTQNVVGISFNKKLFLLYESAVDRSHVWDGSTVRRVGMGTPAVPTVANTGAGAYAATIRYYGVRYVELSGVTVVRQSELSPIATFTPSGAGTAARITKPAAISEGETHWQIEGSPDNITFYVLTRIAVGTATYDDSAAPSTYNQNPAGPIIGTHIAPASYRYGISDDTRLLFAGSWSSAGKSSRIWYTEVLGSADAGDDERIPLTVDQDNHFDVGENDGSFITGFGGPMQGTIIVFKYRSVWKLIPTDDANDPYIPRTISRKVGCIHQKSVVMAEDESGQPSLYWLSYNGPYRLGANGVQYVGRDNEDIWRTVNLEAATIVGHGIYHQDRHQIWWWVSTGSNDQPNDLIIYDTRLGRVIDTNNVARYGWSRFSGDITKARCAVMFSNTVGASMSRDLKPYYGLHSATNTIYKGDNSSQTSDNATNFQAYIDTRPYPPAGSFGWNGETQEAYVIAKVASGVTIQLSTKRDFSAETKTSSVSITAAGTETYTQKKFEGSALSKGGVFSFRIGDASAVSNAWQLAAFTVPMRAEEPR